MSVPFRHPDAVVVGAGIVGAACAAALAREGFRVSIVDSDFPGGGTTSVGMGHIVVLDDSPDQLALSAYSRRLWSELADELPADCEDEPRGTIWIASSDEELETARIKQGGYARNGVEAVVLDERELLEREPALRRGLAGALFVPHDRILYPPGAARHLVAKAESRGAVVRDRSTAISIDRRRVELRTSTGTIESISAGLIVNAAGIDAPRLTPGLPVVPRKGHLVITDRYPDICRSELVELGYLQSAHTLGGASTAFNLQPRATGQLLIGSSRELVGRETGMNRALLRAMVRRAIEFVPALARCSAIRAWTGFRPATPDNLPLIGPWEPSEGVWIAAGHEGLGITLALATAELIVDGVLDRSSSVDPSPFSPMREMPLVSAVVDSPGGARSDR
jgi:glycine/D-amino acid oxidase-like deaminating enzyme